MNDIICSDVMEALRQTPSESVDCVITSPPYWGLRDYGTAKWEGGSPDCDHKIPSGESDPKQVFDGSSGSHAIRFNREHCHKCGAKRIDVQIGLEKTPEEYVAKMVEVFREVKRVLKKEGTLWLNLGDSYVSQRLDGSHGGWNASAGYYTNRVKNNGVKHEVDVENLKPKDLVGIPWRVAFALQADGWYLRQDIIWSKPNPMPESVTDRCTKSHEYVFLLSKSQHYYYDNEAIKETMMQPQRYERRLINPDNNNRKRMEMKILSAPRINPKTIEACRLKGLESGTRNKRSVWTITTQPFPEAHFATFPESLVEPMIKAGTSEKGVCPDCGKAWARVVKKEKIKEARPQGKSHSMMDIPGTPMYRAGSRNDGLGAEYNINFLGWKPSCSCGKDPVPAVVLDPFCGSGTTCLVARKLLRNYIGIELNPKYVEMSNKRLNKIPMRLDMIAKKPEEAKG